MCLICYIIRFVLERSVSRLVDARILQQRPPSTPLIMITEVVG